MGLVVGQPHRGQVVGRQQPRQHRRVDLVGLDLGLGDRPGLLRVGDHHPADLALQQPRDRIGVAGRLQGHLVGGAQAVGEQPQRLRGGLDAARLPDHAVLPDGDLGELAVHVQPDASSHPAPPFICKGCRSGAQVGQTTPTDPRSQRSRASRRGGHVLTRARSPSNDHRPAQPAFAPGCPCPGRSHRTPRPTGTTDQPIRERRRHPPPFIPVTKECPHRAKACGVLPGRRGTRRRQRGHRFRPIVL
jgi:hypothetical protein